MTSLVRRVGLLRVCLVTSALAAAAPCQADFTYTVARGDSIERLARRFYPDYARDPFGYQQRLARANGLHDINVIKVGDELVVPGIDDPGQPTTLRAGGAAQVATPAKRIPWVVQPGDTVSEIADVLGDRFGVSLDQGSILRDNGIVDPRSLQVGSVLDIALPNQLDASSAGLASVSPLGAPIDLLGSRVFGARTAPGIDGPGGAVKGDDLGERPALRGDAGVLQEAGFVQRRRGESEKAAVQRAVKRLYRSATYTGFPANGRIDVRDDGSLRVTIGSRDATPRFKAWLEQVRSWVAEAQALHGDDYDSPSEAAGFSGWIDEASRELTAYRPKSAKTATAERRALLRALLMRETSGGNQAISPAGAIGPGQMMMATAVSQGVNPFDPRANIVGNARFLNSLISRFGGNVTKALAYYNAGSNTHLGMGYANAVLATQRRYLPRGTSAVS